MPATEQRGSFALLVEWPKEEKAPTKYYLSSLPANTPLKKLVRLAKLRWRVEHDYQELKQEVGLDHFEGRSWRGFHHHATLCLVAHGFLALRRALFPPEEDSLDAAQVRRRLQHLLLRRIGHCSLCLRRVGARAPLAGPLVSDRVVLIDIQAPSALVPVFQNARRQEGNHTFPLGCFLKDGLCLLWSIAE